MLSVGVGAAAGLVIGFLYKCINDTDRQSDMFNDGALFNYPGGEESSPNEEKYITPNYTNHYSNHPNPHAPVDRRKEEDKPKQSVILDFDVAIWSNTLIWYNIIKYTYTLPFFADASFPFLCWCLSVKLLHYETLLMFGDQALLCLVIKLYYVWWSSFIMFGDQALLCLVIKYSC